MNKIRTFLSECVRNEYTGDKELKHNSKKITLSHTRLPIGLVSAKMKTLTVEALRNYTHKSFITFFTIGLIFLICLIIEFGRLIWTSSTSTKPEVILDYYLGFVFTVGIFSLTFFLLFVFWEVVHHAINRTTWTYNCVRVLFLMLDVTTAVKWYSAALQARPNGINYILIATYVKAGSLALLAFLYLMWCVYRQRKNKTFQSLLTFKYGVVLFLSIHTISIMTFKYQGVSWQTTGIVCSLFYLGFAFWVMVLSRSREDFQDTESVSIQIKITALVVVLYVIIISLFLVVHYNMDCDNDCGQHTRPSTHIPIKHSLDALHTSKILDGDFTKMKEQMTCKTNQSRRDGHTTKGGRFSYSMKTQTAAVTT